MLIVLLIALAVAHGGWSLALAAGYGAWLVVGLVAIGGAVLVRRARARRAAAVKVHPAVAR